MSLFDKLTAIVGTTPDEEEAYIRPEGNHYHVSPGSAAEVAELVVLAGQEGATVIPVGKGGRSTPVDDMRPQILLNMSRINHVLHLDETSLLVHVQAGLGGLELEAILSKRGLSLGDFPPAALGSSVGGLLSVRTPGKSSRRHGTFEDTVLGLSAILADGRSVHTRVAPRRASGPDLARALCGSEGSLGIITSAVLRVHKKPESRLLAAYRLPDFSEALTAVRLALREEASPAALRIYDTEEARLHLGSVCSGHEAILVAATVGPTSLAACDRGLISSAIEAVGGEPTNEELAATWWNRRTGHDDKDFDLPAPNLQVSATPRKLAPVYEAIRAEAHTLGMSARAHGSRFDRDGGVLFFSIGDANGALAPRAEAMSQIQSAAEAAGAYLLDKNSPALNSYFETLRNTLDPQRILNPGVLR